MTVNNWNSIYKTKGESIAYDRAPSKLPANKPMVMTGRLRTRDRIGGWPVIRWGVTARRDGGMQLTPLRVREIGAFLKHSIGPTSVPNYWWRRN